MPPLCLSPSIQVSRIANTMLRATTLVPPKRKRFCHSGDANGEEEAELEKSSKRERDAMMKIGEEGMTKGRSNA